MSITVLIAPSGFKESLPVDDVTRAIAKGVLRAMPGATILSAPMVDGGEGTTRAIVNATWGVTSGGGPLLTGVLMQSVGVNALPAVMWVCCAIFVGSAVWERRKGIV